MGSRLMSNPPSDCCSASCRLSCSGLSMPQVSIRLGPLLRRRVFRFASMQSLGRFLSRVGGVPWFFGVHTSGLFECTGLSRANGNRRGVIPFDEEAFASWHGMQWAQEKGWGPFIPCKRANASLSDGIRPRLTLMRIEKKKLLVRWNRVLICAP